MHFQYLVEDQSGAALIRILMQKIVELSPNATYDCKGFRGIGGFTRKNTIKETKTGKLLNDLATYLRGFDRSLQSFPSVIIVVLDSDDHDVQQFRSELEAVAMQNMIKIDIVNGCSTTPALPLPSAPLLPNWKSVSICSRFLKQQKNNWSRSKRS